jgi:hypothetical protein
MMAQSTTAEKIVRESMSRPAPRGQAAPPEEILTLERKLAAGEGLSAVATHRFEGEPLRLTLTFANAERQAAFAGHLRQAFADSGSETTDSAPRLSVRARRNEGVAAADVGGGPVFYEGRPSVNFTARRRGERQFILRVSPGVFDGLIAEAATQDSERIQLGVGAWTVTGVDEVRKLARHVLGEPPVATDAPQANTNLMAWMERIGFAPPGLMEEPSAERGSAGNARRRAATNETEAAAAGAGQDEPWLTLVIDLTTAESAEADPAASDPLNEPTPRP